VTELFNKFWNLTSSLVLCLVSRNGCVVRVLFAPDNWMLLTWPKFVLS